MGKMVLGRRWRPWVAVACLAISGAAFAADVNKLVAVCSDCHGKLGASTDPNVPIIGGYSSEFLVDNLKDYQTKDRDCPETKYVSGSKKGQKTDMCQVIKGFSDADIKAVAGYFAKQKFVCAKQKFDPDLAKKGESVHADYCEKCHSKNGTESVDDTGMPGGQWTPYLRHAIEEFQTEKRPIPKKMKAKLDEVDKPGLEALVNFYAKQCH